MLPHICGLPYQTTYGTYMLQNTAEGTPASQGASSSSRAYASRLLAASISSASSYVQHLVDAPASPKATRATSAFAACDRLPLSPPAKAQVQYRVEFQVDNCALRVRQRVHAIVGSEFCIETNLVAGPRF